MTYYQFGLFIPRMLQVRDSIGLGNGYSFGNDFYPIWLAACELRARHSDVYSDRMTREIQTGIFGHPLEPGNKLNLPSDYRQYSYPAFTNLLFWPAAFLDFPRLRIILALLFPGLTALSTWMWVKALRWPTDGVWTAVFIILTISSYQLLEAFFALQPGVLVGFLLAAAALALRRGRLMLAGALCGLTLIKPQVTVLAVAYLLLWSFSRRTRARFWQGFLLVSGTLMLCSLLIWPGWVGEWLGVLFRYRSYARPPLVSLILGSTFLAYAATLITASMIAVSAIIIWKNRLANQDTIMFWFTLSFLLAITTVVLMPGQAMYDHFVLIPGILLLVKYRTQFRAKGRVQRILVLIGAITLFWPWFSSFALVTLRPLFQPATFYSVSVFALPIRNVASLPFAIVALLAWNWKDVPEISGRVQSTTPVVPMP